MEMMHFYARFLEKRGFVVSTSSNGIDALNKAMVLQPSLVILDLMNTEQAGLKLVRQLRNSTLLSRVGIILHTTNIEYWENQEEVLKLVDRIIEKPVIPNMLEETIMKMIVEIKPKSEQEIKLDFVDFSIDIEGYTVRRGASVIDLTKREFELILLLAGRPGKLFTRKEIVEQLWGKESNAEDRILDVYIAKLRKKLGKEIIHTLKGVGYSLGLSKHVNT